MEDYLKLLDSVIGISGSGNFCKVIKTIEHANIVGAMTFENNWILYWKVKQNIHANIIVRIKDMQKVEDVDVILVHLTMPIISGGFNDGEDGRRLIIKVI